MEAKNNEHHDHTHDDDHHPYSAYASSWPWMKGIDEAITSQPIEPVTIHDNRPLVVDLIKQHRQKIDKIKAEVSKHPLYEPTKHDDLWLLRYWLTQQKSKPAIEAAIAALELRKKHNMDAWGDIRNTPPNQVKTGPVATYYSHIPKDACYFDVPDEQRSAIAYFRLSKINYQGFVNDITPEEWVQPYLYFSEWNHQWVDYVARRTGRFTKTVRFMDVSGMGLSTVPRQAANRDAKAVAELADLYPQLFETMYLCFPPKVFHLMWKVVRLLIPNRLLNKIEVIDPISNDKERARAYKAIAEENIAIAFGGKKATPLDSKSCEEK
mmetsp:Transcript_21321/g.60872  ORF Transcript_21321/g.60872 Transcript_21321/m.60872 type:complete len:323 (+) Transcript_21321:98-1066(+)|eukprot:CAMPEP_0119565444 /NCGR_PEP_ID=MMETSP1352-20130426/30053_1 /TAXON_ID=265584 /ORGANISM="Stauroneis constricta, Strain CCMP1120" /LENGTH=322 /DNA_ID=CAMNT_0007614359 /DNA_START=9 /DNA_END=977 /DNA_ORIENTATION=+